MTDSQFNTYWRLNVKDHPVRPFHILSDVSDESSLLGKKTRLRQKQNRIEQGKKTDNTLAHAHWWKTKWLETERRLITSHDKYLHSARTGHHSGSSASELKSVNGVKYSCLDDDDDDGEIFSFQLCSPFLTVFIRFILAIKFINEICLFAQFCCGKEGMVFVWLCVRVNLSESMWIGDGNLNTAAHAAMYTYIYAYWHFRFQSGCWIDFIRHSSIYSVRTHPHNTWLFRSISHMPLYLN